jgi:hypothetical protein
MHILNLVVKVILCQFNVLKAKANKALDDASQALVDLAGDIEMKEAAMDEKDDDKAEDDNREEGWVDPLDEMLQDEQDVLNLAVHPI